MPNVQRNFFGFPYLKNHSLVALEQDVRTDNTCSICSIVCSEIIQLSCGHRLCVLCYDQLFVEKTSNILCPIDHSISSQDQFHTCKDFVGDLANKAAFCFNRINGCPFRGPLSSIQAHSSFCGYNLARCQKCDQIYLRKDIIPHVSSACVAGKAMASTDLEVSLQGVLDKLTLLQEKYSSLSEELQCVQRRFEDQEAMLNSDKMKFQDIEQKVDFQANVVEKYNEKCLNKLMEQKSQLDNFQIALNCTDDKVNLMTKKCEDIERDMKEQLTRQEELETRFATEFSVRDYQRGTTQPQKEDTGKAISAENQQTSILVKDLIGKVRIAEDRLDSLSTYHWTVQYTAEMQRAVRNGSNKKFKSDKFYSHFQGYYMNLFLMGEKESDGGIYLGIYLSIQPGQNDLHLEWPFKRNYSFKLINQRNPNRSISYVIDLDEEQIKHKGFQRQIMANESGFGAPILPVNEFEQGGYVQNDVFNIEFLMN